MGRKSSRKDDETVFYCVNKEKGCSYIRNKTDDRKGDQNKCWQHENRYCPYRSTKIKTLEITEQKSMATIIYRWRDNENRDLGLIAAKLLQLCFKERNLSCFLDTTNLLPGTDLKNKLKEEMINNKNVLLLVTPDCFERCTNQEDFFWWEIETAINNNCNIVPLVFYDSDIIGMLPEKLKENEHRFSVLQNILQNKLEIYFDVEHLNSVVEKILKACN